MRAYFAFTKKEFTENLRTYKLYIMGLVFLLFGIMSPAIAKITPDILKSVSISGLKVDNTKVPDALDSWTQFFKNVGQMGLLVLVIVFCGIMANEFSRGTLINILTKGMKRSTAILSKFTMASIVWTLSYLLCFVICYFYTAYFWEMIGMNNVFLTFFSMWLFGVFLISILILGGTLFKNIYGSLLLAFVSVVVMSLINIVPEIKKFNPITLSIDNMALLKAEKAVSDFVPAVIICAILIIASMAASIAVFNKKQV